VRTNFPRPSAKAFTLGFYLPIKDNAYRKELEHGPVLLYNLVV